MYVADIAQSCMNICESFEAVCSALENEPRGGEIERHLASRILQDLRPVLVKLAIESEIHARFGGSATSVLDLQDHTPALSEL